MKIIEITTLTKRRIITMVKALNPNVKYVRVRANGLLIMKEHWYSLRKQVIPVTDAILLFLPKLIVKDNKEMEAQVNDAVNAMIYLKRYVESYDIIEYLWHVFNQMYVKVPLNYFLITTKTKRLIASKVKQLPIMTPTGETLKEIKRIYLNVISPNSLNNIIQNYTSELAFKVRLRLAY